MPSLSLLMNWSFTVPKVAVTWPSPTDPKFRRGTTLVVRSWSAEVAGGAVPAGGVTAFAGVSVVVEAAGGGAVLAAWSDFTASVASAFCRLRSLARALFVAGGAVSLINKE